MAFTPQQATGKKLGSYELVKEVSASSVGATFVARAAGERAVMLTKIHRHVAKSPQLCDAFHLAAKKASALEHANIVRVVSSGTIDGEPFVAHEHFDGDSLASLLRRAGPEGLPLPIAERIILDLLLAITAAHETSDALGHGELGPWCVHLGVDGIARVSGFAIDRAISRFGLHFAKNLDRLPYAAPERVKAMSLTLGPAPAAPDPRADAFSAAVLAWELVTRQRLFASRMEAAIIQKVIATTIPDPRSQRPEISELMSRALVGMLQREPGTRQGAAELVRAIETGDPASHDAVAEFASRQVDRSQARPMPAGTSGFHSVRPSAAPLAPVLAPIPGAESKRNGSPPSSSNGPSPGSAPRRPNAPVKAPVRSRASTLMGIAVTPAPPPPVDTVNGTGELELEVLFEEDTTVEKQSPVLHPLASPAGATRGAAQTAAVAPAPEPRVGATTANLGTPVMAASAASGASPTATLSADQRTAPDAEIDHHADSRFAPSAARPPARRPPPKARQQTLMGIEPLTEDAAPGATPAATLQLSTATLLTASGSPEQARPSATTPAPREIAATATPSAGALGSPTGPARARDSLLPRAGGGDQLGTGAMIGRPPEAYQLLAPIARGGMATVWAARPEGSHSLDRLVAIKTMLPELSDEPDFESMFLDEMRVAARIKHDNVAQILSVGEEAGVMYLVMEWVDGETFGAIQQAARSSGGVPLPILIRMASDICAGLHAAHELTDETGNLIDLVHRDVNPSNVIVGRDGVSKVVDFGIAKSKGRIHVTRAGSTVKGKTPYLSPEQLGGLTLDRRSDLFSLGALLYLMSTGIHPFRGESEIATIENVVLKSPTPLRSYVPNIHPDFEKLVLRLLEKDPKKRLVNADQVRLELQRIEELLEKPATTQDVAVFVEKMAADVLAAREKELLDAHALLDPEGAHPPPSRGVSTLVGVAPAAAEVASPFGPDLLRSFESESAELDRQERMDVIAEAQPLNPSAGAAIIQDAPLGIRSDLSSEVTVDQHELGERGSEPASSSSHWIRLVFLIVLGVATGIGIIALIEVLRRPDGAPDRATTTATATGTSAAPQSTSAPTVARTVAPVMTVAPAPTETASAAEEPSAPPTATASARPGGAAPVSRPLGRPTAPRPPASSKKTTPNFRHNPSGI